MSEAAEILESAQAFLTALGAVEDPTIDDLAELSVGLVGVADRLNALHATVCRKAEVAGVAEIDGSTSLAAYVAHRAGTSKPRVSKVLATGRFLADHPVISNAAVTGETSAAHVDLLARATRSGPQVESMADPATQEQLLGYADRYEFVDWRKLVAHWQSVTDPDGVEEKAAQAHQDRRFSLTALFGGGYAGVIELGNLDGAMVSEAVARLADEFFQSDLAEARERLGYEPALDELARSHKQRCADAFVELVRRGADVSDSLTSVLPLVSLHIDHETFEATIDWLNGNEHAYEGCDPETRVCEDLAGNPVAPTEVFEATLRGRIHRIVYGAESETIDYGRAKRLFTGKAREAALLTGRWCQHPGCRRPARWCQIDHIQAWENHGRSDQNNAQTLCGYHNRWKYNHHDRPNTDAA